MITLEEAQKQGLTIAGRGTKPAFIVSSVADRGADKNISITNDIEDLLNEQLCITNYSDGKVEHLTITYIILPSVSVGAKWQERTYYKQNNKNFYIDLRFAEYETFCKADEKTALKIMAEQTLRGTQKYLPSIKGFESQKFIEDLEKLFYENKLIEK